MNQQDDATRLANLLKELRIATLAMAEARDPSKRESLADAIKQKRDDIFKLVERYFQQALRPVLADRFPGKGIQSAPQKERIHSNDAMFRYSELVNDFFVQVLSRFDDPFWKKDSAIELRNWASIVISNKIRNALKRSDKQKPFSDELEDQLAAEVEQNFLAEDLDLELAGVLDILHQWQRSQDEKLGKMAALICRKYITDPFERDLNALETDESHAREKHMEFIATELRISLATAYRYHNEAIASLREILCP